MYACIAGSGVALWFIPVPFLEDVVGWTFFFISLFLIIGGGVSMIGHWSRILILEKAGYPLILTALVSLTGLLFKGADDQAARVFIALLIFGFTLGLYGRWRDLATLVELQQRHRSVDELLDEGE